MANDACVHEGGPKDRASPFVVLADFSGDGYSCSVVSPSPGTGLSGVLRGAVCFGTGSVRVFDDSEPFHLLDGISPRDAARLISSLATEGAVHPFWKALTERAVEAALGVALLRADCTGDRRCYGLSALAALLSDPGEAGRAVGEASAALMRKAEGSGLGMGVSSLSPLATALPHIEGLSAYWGMAGPVRDGVRRLAEDFVDRFGVHPLAGGAPVARDALLPASGPSVFVNGYSSASGPGIQSLAGGFLRLKALSQHRMREGAASRVIPVL